jgi:minor histocompatibility antigen H13
MDPPAVPNPLEGPLDSLNQTINQTISGNQSMNAMSVLHELWEHPDLLMLEAKLVLSAMGVIYLGAHGALRRPPSAAPAKSREGKDEEKEEQYTQGLLPSDAIVFPLLAGIVLTGLYYLIQWLQDPEILNKIMRVYMSTMSVASLTTLYAHALQLFTTLAFPRYWRSGARLYRIDQAGKRHLSCDKDGKTTKIAESDWSPLPGPFSALPLPLSVVKGLWEVRYLLTGDWAVRLRVHGIIEEKFKMKFNHIMGLLFALATTSAYFVSGSKMLSNLMGHGFCYGSFMLLSPTTFTTSTLVLLGLFVYDIVMVFYT